MHRIVMLVLGPCRLDLRVEREAGALSQGGFRVSIIAWNRVGQLPQAETLAGCELFRLGPSLPKMFPRFLMSARFFIKILASLFFYMAAINRAIRLKPEVIHAHDLDTLVPALVLKLLMNSRVVFDSHEDYPAMLLPLAGRTACWLALAGEKLLLKGADVVIASSEAISRNLPYTRKPFIVRNAVDLSRFDAVSGGDLTHRVSVRPIVIYAGAVGEGRGLDQLLEAAQLTRSDICVVIARKEQDIEGPKYADLKAKCERRGIHAQFIEHGHFPSLIRQATIGVALFQPDGTNSLNILPNKLFEYMAGGIPVIVSDFPLLRKVVRGNDCGVTVDPTSVQQIADAIDYLLSNSAEARRLGANGRKAVEEKYSWRIEKRELARAYASIDWSRCACGFLSHVGNKGLCAILRR